jgi:uncharacterized protein with HEPN domain
MDDEVKKYLFDIQEAISSIETYLGEKRDYHLYRANKMLRRAVERELEIIGEAMHRLDMLDSALVVSGKRQIIGMRNRIIHGYDKIDDEIVWGTLVRHLPLLKSEINKLME